jgi:hypothetical protein
MFTANDYSVSSILMTLRALIFFNYEKICLRPSSSNFCIVNKTFRLVNIDFYVVNTRVDPLVLTFVLLINTCSRKSNIVYHVILLICRSMARRETNRMPVLRTLDAVVSARDSKCVAVDLWGMGEGRGEECMQRKHGGKETNCGRF